MYHLCMTHSGVPGVSGLLDVFGVFDGVLCVCLARFSFMVCLVCPLCLIWHGVFGVLGVPGVLGVLGVRGVP